MATSTLVFADDDDDDDEIPFEEGWLFFELSDTDGDLGIHAKIDGDDWKKLENGHLFNPCQASEIINNGLYNGPRYCFKPTGRVAARIHPC
ncbi:hypothetical protein MnTg03_01263 [bacterium MnTg03]|nr:hypothetical protein MnTg03_01263 [bacterium MnTg03]